MLVLTRKLEEKIRIGDDITISILRVKGNTVRVGIDAPRTIRVVRGELPAHSQGEPSHDQASHDQASHSEPIQSEHGQGETPSPVSKPARINMAENGSTEEDTPRADLEKPDPATTAVRRFLASRARRQNGSPKSNRSGRKPLAASLTRSA